MQHRRSFIFAVTLWCALYFGHSTVFAQQFTPRMPAQALLPDGAADCSSLGLLFAADTDTGIVRTAANTIGFCTGGALRASLSASGLDLATVLAVAEGGTGVATLTAHAVLLGNGTSALQAIACTGTTSIYQGGSPGSCTVTPTIGTSLTDPLLIGGTAVGSNITYKSTTGVGTLTGIAHQWTGGTNGATVIATMLNNGDLGLGTTLPVRKFHLQVQSTGFAPADSRSVAVIEGTADPYLLFSSDSTGSTGFMIDRSGVLDGWFDYSLTSRFMAFGVAGAERVRLDSAGNIGIATTSFGTSAVGVFSQGIGTAPSTSPADVFQRTVVDSFGAGTASWQGRDEQGFLYTLGNAMFLLGGTTSSFPALQRSAALMLVRLADDSADATLRALTLRTACVAIASLPAGVTGDRKCVSDQLTACPALDGTFTAGGVVVCSAFYNGTAWVHA